MPPHSSGRLQNKVFFPSESTRDITQTVWTNLVQVVDCHPLNTKLFPNTMLTFLSRKCAVPKMLIPCISNQEN